MHKKSEPALSNTSTHTSTVKINSAHYDIVVIGAGIQGAGIAQAAAARGYKTLLLEQYPQPAQGTSSRSSKLIHGGLRYLETGQLRLVYECLRERRYLLKNAPELVTLKNFYIPVYRNNKRPAWLILVGLSLYALLSGFEKNNRFKKIPRNQWPQLDGLNLHQLCAVYQYHDAQTDDTKLTQAVLQSAETLGAKIYYNAECTQAERTQTHYNIHYQIAAEQQHCTASILINATGPWVNQLLQRITPLPPQLNVSFIQGTHILIPGQLKCGIYYLESRRDQRAIFIMPWTHHNDQACTLIGTTETTYTGRPENVKPLREEIHYLLDVFNQHFPKHQAGRQISEHDIITSIAGLRVLPEAIDTPFLRPRETRFTFDDPRKPRLLTLYGGKLTSYRATAEKAINLIKHQLPPATRNIKTQTLSLGN